MHRLVLLLGLAASCLRAGTDPQAALARLRERIASDLQRLPNYTCVETVRREYFTPVLRAAAASCQTLADAKTRSDFRLDRWSVDQLRLDVAVTSSRELYSWAGAREFETRDLAEMIGGGPIGTGAFGSFLSTIFASPAVQFTYAGATDEAGRTLMKFAYRVARENSRYQVRASDGWVITGYDGEIVVDPAANDLIRLTIRAAGLPASTGTCETQLQMTYRRVAVGELDVLLPAASRQHFLLRNGAESENTSAFSSCREYRGESTLTFLPESAGEPAGTESNAAPLKFEALPGDLPVILELTAPVDTWTASGGEMIGLRLARPIVDAAKHVLVPAGAAIQARLMRVQRFFTKPERVTVVVAPETIDRGGTRLPFPVLPLQKDAAFSFVGDHVVVPKGYHTAWYTR